MQLAEILTHPQFEPQETSLEQYTRDYCSNLFLGENGRQLHILPKVGQHAVDHIVGLISLASQIEDESEKNTKLTMMIGKIKHTYHVVQAGQMIADATMNTYHWRPEEVASATLLHDMARFDQAYLHMTFSDKDKGFYHGQIGANRVRHAGLPITMSHEPARVENAIWWHAEKDYLGKDPLANIVRDADKLALLWEFPQIGDIDSNSYLHLPPARGEQFHVPGEDDVYSDFFGGRLVDSKYVRTQGDVILRYLSWIYGFHFLETKRMLASTNILETVAEKLKQFEQNDPLVRENLPKILDTIRNWKEEVLQAA